MIPKSYISTEKGITRIHSILGSIFKRLIKRLKRPHIYDVYFRGYFTKREEAAFLLSKEDIYSASFLATRGLSNPIASKILFQNSKLYLHFLALLPNGSTVVDFGGGYGVTYRNLYAASEGLNKDLDYVVIEKDEYVPIFRENEREIIKYMTLDEYYCSQLEPDIIFCCSSLQYLEYPFASLGKLISKKPKVMILANTPMVSHGRSYYMIQHHVGRESIYTVFSVNELDSYFKRNNYMLTGAYKDEWVNMSEYCKENNSIPEKQKKNTHSFSRIYKLIE